MELNRTGSIWDRTNRNGINSNWGIIESFLTKFDGTKLYEVSHNIYDNRNFGQGSISVTTGEVVSGGFVHAIVNVEPNKKYTTEASGVGAYYDSSGTYISGIASSSSERRKMTTPANAALMKLTLGSYQLDTFMVYEGWDDKPYMPYGVLPTPLIIAPELQGKIDEAMVMFKDVDGLTINRGKDFPLKSVQLGSQEPAEIAENAKNVILDAKVSGANPDMYYRLNFISNGHEQGGKPRYGITLGEYRKSDGWRTRWVFTYNDADTPENQQNYNIEKGSDGIDTIIAVREDIVVSVTVDRAAITASNTPTYVNLNSGISASPSAVIDPSTYSAF